MSAITTEVVRALADFDADGDPVTTCYLNVDGRERVRPVDYERELERLVRRLKGTGPLAPGVGTDLDRIAEHLRNGLDRSAVRGIAVFSCSTRDLWEVVPLPVPVRSRLVVGPTPAISQLASVVEQLSPIGILLVDRQRTRILVFEGGALIDRSERVDELPRDYDERDHAARGDVSNHVDELAQQHLRLAAKAAFEVFQDHRVERVAIGGSAEAVADLEPMLHPYLRERLVERLKLGVAASLDEIRNVMLDIEARTERREEAASVERLRDAVGAGDRGVSGLADTLDALNARRVELLLVSEGFEASGWRCGACGMLAAVGPTCPSCERPMDHLDDVVEDAIQEAIHQSCRIEMCVENADLDVLGRIGAVLRF